MQKVGSRELKNRFGRYLRAVKEGKSVLVTDRGKTVAKLSPANDNLETSLAQTLEQLQSEGYLRLGKKPMRKFRPIPSRGKSASDMIVEDRR